MEPIVFTLNNTGIHSTYISMTLEIIHLLILEDDKTLYDYCLTTGINIAEFSAMYKKIVEEEAPQYPCTANKIATLYCCIFFVTKAFVSAEHEKKIQQFIGEELPGFIHVREKYLAFAGVALRKFAKDLKRVPEIIRAKRITEEIAL